MRRHTNEKLVVLLRSPGLSMRDDQRTDSSPELRVGDLVEVRSAEEILLTLDERGALDCLPFMPEMLQFCGQRFAVAKRAGKACTPSDGSIRQVRGAVHLDGVRCDGSAHGGCEANCLLYWKEDWLKPVVLPGQRGLDVRNGNRGHKNISFGTWSTIEVLKRNTTVSSVPSHAFYCQATAIPEFGQSLPAWHLGQYVRDLTSGNVRPIELWRGLVTGFTRKIEFHVSRPWKPQQSGGTRTPYSKAEFGDGDIVEILPIEEIESTLDSRGRNRGLSFTPEMRDLCGRRFRVSKRIHKIIDERTGRMLRLAGGCLLLEGAICRGDRHRFCPRMAHLFWRDIWLRGVHAEAPATVTEISTICAPRTAEAVATSAARIGAAGS